ncbi:MAG: IS4 family transposase [Thermoguttaceae bacterium]
MTITMDAQLWAKEQFGVCNLHDQRRTLRLTKLAASMLCHPSGSLPEQMTDMADLKAAYRLFACEGVTFQAIAGPHWEQTRRRPPGTYLVLDDTTELDFGIRRGIPGMCRTGNGGGWGFLLHSALMVGAEGEEVIGLAGQKIRYRKPTPKKENTTQRLKRDRESRLWGQVIDMVGPPADGVRWVHVMDRGADNFEVYCHCWEQRSDWVARVTQKQRNVIVSDGKKMALSNYLKTLPLAGEYELFLRARGPNRKRGSQPARTANVEVRFGALKIPVPSQKSPYVQGLSPMPIAMWVVYAQEVDAPKDVEAVQWILLTSLPVESFNDAWRILGYYEKRWLIEEWHKALKSGCRVEQRQLKSKEGLERITGLFSVIAVRLLQLKSAARTNPDRLAGKIVPRHWIAMLLAARKRRNNTVARTMTIGEFYRELAKLGGFLGRKSDGEPGWITIWRGWQKLYLLVRGAELAKDVIKCG